MSKIHTKLKRKLGLRSTSRKHRFWFTAVHRVNGPKSFSSLEAAEKYATEKKLDQKKYTLHVTPSGKVQWRPIKA